MNRIRIFLAVVTLLMSAGAWAGPVNVNHADAATLMKELHGIGEKRAAAIVSERTANGPYKDAADLGKRVSGIGQKTLAQNKGDLRF